MVWHHRRNSLRAYLRQQTGYGRAESLLERAHPEKFNGLGQVRWAGRIYAALPSGRLFSRPRIYQGIFGSAPFQSIYQPSEGLVAYLMQTPEWYALLLGMIVLSVLNPLLLLLPILCLGAQAAVCAHAALTAQLPKPFLAQQEPHLRWLIFWMHFLQPLARAWGRW
jgi:hypothetical protein